jgi:hypothetical protein
LVGQAPDSFIELAGWLLGLQSASLLFVQGELRVGVLFG